MQPPSTPALKYHPAEQCRLKRWHRLCQAPPWEVLVAIACSLRNHSTSNPKPKGRRGKIISRESWRFLGASWFLKMVLVIVSQRGTLKQDCPPHVCEGQHTPRYRVSPQGFSGIWAFLLHGTVYSGVPCPMCTPQGHSWSTTWEHSSSSVGSAGPDGEQEEPGDLQKTSCGGDSNTLYPSLGTCLEKCIFITIVVSRSTKTWNRHIKKRLLLPRKV